MPAFAQATAAAGHSSCGRNTAAMSRSSPPSNSLSVAYPRTPKSAQNALRNFASGSITATTWVLFTVSNSGNVHARVEMPQSDDADLQCAFA